VFYMFIVSYLVSDDIFEVVFDVIQLLFDFHINSINTL